MTTGLIFQVMEGIIMATLCYPQIHIEPLADWISTWTWAILGVTLTLHAGMARPALRARKPGGPYGMGYEVRLVNRGAVSRATGIYIYHILSQLK